ncbi:FG-GAP-like repeat-containing protein [Plantactinospora sp. KLBMP9567]|uniref:FG-GAP-like repeat-containing protein n=1 Tax=Plantactinospora sp. KLBMP9567 TaxID=3085900 RepID=UPI0029826953|nr:FG-GAP-like repeat-containing protein [Plantactinospora sp. KLBMP9567]MDW5323432.1 FG-GAP-like repeat-containing protein [Plantactinospora sp. KLBMP9567]
MWRRPIVVGTATATILAIATAVPPAGAAGPNDPLYGDLNGDGLLDRARLGTAARTCAVLVESGRPEGGYLPVRSHPYRVPGAGAPTACPDLGVAVDLDAAPGPAELVVGWYEGNPGRSGHDLLVLRDYRVVAALPALRQLNVIGLADFDGDRRWDVYLWTDQGEGFASFLNTGTATLTPGPVRYCAGPLTPRLADFDSDGAADVAIAYIDGCADDSHGVVVVYGDGRVVDLQRGVGDRSSWTMHVLDVDHSGVPDVLTYHRPSGERRTFLAAGDGTFVRSPLATRDVVTVVAGGSVRISVLHNDWASRRARLSVLVAPANGTAEIGAGRVIVYRPGPDPDPVDRFVYRISQDGRTSDAAVSIRITP